MFLSWLTSSRQVKEAAILAAFKDTVLRLKNNSPDLFPSIPVPYEVWNPAGYVIFCKEDDHSYCSLRLFRDQPFEILFEYKPNDKKPLQSTLIVPRRRPPSQWIIENQQPHCYGKVTLDPSFEEVQINPSVYDMSFQSCETSSLPWRRKSIPVFIDKLIQKTFRQGQELRTIYNIRDDFQRRLMKKWRGSESIRTFVITKEIPNAGYSDYFIGVFNPLCELEKRTKHENFIHMFRIRTSTDLNREVDQTIHSLGQTAEKTLAETKGRLFHAHQLNMELLQYGDTPALKLSTLENASPSSEGQLLLLFNSLGEVAAFPEITGDEALLMPAFKSIPYSTVMTADSISRRAKTLKLL